MAGLITKRTDVYTALLHDLATGEIVPGQKLGEETLANRYEVSRLPVRDALIRLESEGLVERRPQSGSYVRQLDADEVEELIGLRAAIERLVIRKVAVMATDSQLEDLDQLAREADKSEQGLPFDEISEREMRFHGRLCEIARMRHALRILKIHHLFTLSFRWSLRHTGGSNGREAEHQEIVQALRTRDPDWCEAVMKRHLETGLAYLRSAEIEKTHDI